MILRAILVFCASFFSTAVAGETTEADSGQYCKDARILRNTFEEPLRVELLNSGLTPRNAEVAVQNILNSFVDCSMKSCRRDAIAEQSTMVLVLGGRTIIIYKSLCVSAFLADVDEVTRRAR